MTRRGRVLIRGLLLLAGGALFLMFGVCSGALDFVVQSAIYAAVGWVRFLPRVVPTLAPNPVEVGTAAAALVAVVAGVHRLGCWLARDGWRWRTTLRTAGLLLALFAAGTAMIGVTHELAWLATSPEPLLRTDHGRGDVTGSTVTNSLKQIGVGSQGYHDVHNRLPSPALSPDGRLLHSWHTAILPYIEEDKLYRRVRRDLPWDDPANADAVATPVMIFRHPKRPKNPPTAAAFVPDVRLFDRPRSLQDFPGGLSNTLLAAEAVTEPRPWADPQNWRDPRVGLGPNPAGFGGPWPAGRTLVVLLDGSVRMTDPAGWQSWLASGKWPD